MKRAIVDIETNNLSANIIHCIVAHSYDGSTEKVWIGDECLQFGDWSKQIDQFANILEERSIWQRYGF